MTDNLSIENKLKEYFAKQYQITDSEDENPFYINRPEELNGGNNIEGIVENIMTGGRAGEKCLKMAKRKIKGLTGGKIRKDSRKSSSDNSTKDSSDDSSDDSTKDSTDNSTKDSTKDSSDNSTKDSTKDSSDNSTDDSSDASTKDSSKSSTDDSSDNSTKDSSDASTKKATKKASKKATKKMADKDDDDFDFQIFDSSGNEILDGNDSDTSSDSDDDRYKNKSSSSSSSDYVSDDDSLDDALDDDEDIENYIKKIMTGGKVETVKIIQKFPYVIEKEWRCVKYGCERNVRQTYVNMVVKEMFVRLTYTVKEVCRNNSGKISVNLA